jgi:hypothetical protein
VRTPNVGATEQWVPTIRSNKVLRRHFGLETRSSVGNIISSYERYINGENHVMKLQEILEDKLHSHDRQSCQHSLNLAVS